MSLCVYVLPHLLYADLLLATRNVVAYPYTTLCPYRIHCSVGLPWALFRERVKYPDYLILKLA